jgi:hypothetical protein
MAELGFILLVLGAVIGLAVWKAPVWAWAVLVAVVTLLIQTGYAFGPMGGFTFTKLLGWLPAIALAVLAYRPFRRQYVITPAFRMVKKILPPVSATEREALEAGTIGFDAEIFGGTPDWDKLRSVRPLTLTSEERAFLDGPSRSFAGWPMTGRSAPSAATCPRRSGISSSATAFLACSSPRSMAGWAFPRRRNRWCSERSPRARRTSPSSSWCPTRSGPAS